MKKSLSIGAFLLIILLSSSLFASGVGLTGIGARATALGGNFRAIANDWSAMYWNPAGISQIQGMQFGSGLEILCALVGITNYRTWTLVNSLKKQMQVVTILFFYLTFQANVLRITTLKLEAPSLDLRYLTILPTLCGQ